MRPFAKLIHQTHISYLPKAFSAQYYGMPNGKIYLVYPRFYEGGYGKSGMEFVFAVHQEFFYDYENEKIISINNNNNDRPVFAESVDKPDPKIHIVKVRKNLNSFGEAQILLNQTAQKMSRYAKKPA